MQVSISMAGIIFRKKIYCCILHKAKSFNNKNFYNQKIPIPNRSLVVKENNRMGLPLGQVVKILEELAPLKLSESWDNVGLLVESDKELMVSKALLTIDLTEEVVDEAVELDAQLIISYHPNIFRPFKTLTQSTWKERILVKCIKNNISVFSPHTTWDAIQDGVNDWLGKCLNPKSSIPILPNNENPNIGMGRKLTLSTPFTLQQAVEKVKSHIDIPHVRVGVAKGINIDSKITTVALCAGSGGSVLANTDADLFLTGEMLHHDVLDATQRGIHVILCNHSDSERGFLNIFKQQNILGEQVQLLVSKVDKDCLTVF